MAQLNPNFEIDFSDINSYEQIQLINDTQLAKENLLMHRAYQEPSDDEIIRNHFSSFTFVDFCPKLFTHKQPKSARGAASPDPIRNISNLETTSTDHLTPSSSSSSSVKYYELETFSDLFERINKWLKLNKDWRVVSMETLVFDCKSQFNYQKSSIHSTYLPQNTRGLRLFLSPSKSRFSGPQKIGCINVVPRKLSGSHTNLSDNSEPVVYETLGDILNRLNELLLTRPIDGRILSVETITLPMSNGFVNTESNYFMDSRLNLLLQCTYTNCNNHGGCCSASTDAPSTSYNPTKHGHHLIDILRVYYEFGPTVGGLVNLIDFIPRFYSPTPTNQPQQQQQEPQQVTEPANNNQQQPQQQQQQPQVFKEAATESLTRLIRRSLAWFESERKRILDETRPQDSDSSSKADKAMVNLKVCNLQVHHKTLLKHQLLNVNPSNVIDSINTHSMMHEPLRNRPATVCNLCNISTHLADSQDWCSHLIEQTQIYQLKFVRLAYVVPVHNKHARSIYPIRSLRLKSPALASSSSAASIHQTAPGELSLSSTSSSISTSSSSSSSSTPTSSSSSNSSSSSSSPAQSPVSASAVLSKSEPGREGKSPEESSLKSVDGGQGQQVKRSESVGPEIDKAIVEEILTQSKQQEDLMRQTVLAIVNGTNERHRQDEETHQLAKTDSALHDAPIGQLTYRLFAPCQLVKSSSCFSINPVNSSSPLSRRGSLDLNGSGLSSEDAHPSSLLLASSAGHSQTSLIDQSCGGGSSSSGPFFPHLVNTSDFLSGATGQLTDGSLFGARTNYHQQETNSNNKYFASNEFELVDAIKRRMEVYVTTNSMKVIAGETLIINLSDSLSCLSTAIEQTVIKAPAVRSRSSTWVCVYVLYAAVDEPHLLFAHQQQQKKLSRQLEHIDEERASEEDENLAAQLQQQAQVDIEPHFDDDFKCDVAQQSTKKHQQQLGDDGGGEPANDEQQERQQQLAEEQEEADMIDRHSVANIIYNSAYDRTVALPTSPDNNDTVSRPMEPIELLGTQSAADYLWLDENDLVEIQQQQQQQHDQRNFEVFRHLERRRSGGKKRRSSKANKKLHDHDSQCSLI